MKKSIFKRDQNGKQLLIDCNHYSEAEIKDFSRFYTSNYYEIHLIESKDIRLYADDRQIILSGYNILFLSPQNIRRWERENKKVSGHILLFEAEYVSEFLKENLFLYRLHIFNHNAIPYLKLSAGEYKNYMGLFQEIDNEIRNYTPTSKDNINAAMHYFLIKLNNHYSDFHALSKDSATYLCFCKIGFMS